MEHPEAITFASVGKHYRVRRHKSYLMRDAAQKLLLRKIARREFWALRDVSFRINEGEAVGFIGGNGAGKSTLLALVAGTVYPTTGDITVRGRIGALLELGAGFHPDMTGRENIYLNASLLGMSRDEVDACYEKVVEFSELGEFIDLPLRTYSSGMHVRLGFSVAVYGSPDILIMDEALAVGDQHFQKKCLERIAGLRDRNITLLFVSHHLRAIESICERVIWLDHGCIRADGVPGDVLPEYEQYMAAMPDGDGPWFEASDLGEGWRWLPWFGAYNIRSYPWILHEHLGWLQLVSQEDGNLVFYDPHLQEHWSTNSSTYPHVYFMGAREGWRYYQPGSSTPRVYYVVATESWEEV